MSKATGSDKKDVTSNTMSNGELVMHYIWFLYCYLLSMKLLSDPLLQSISFHLLKDAVH